MNDFIEYPKRVKSEEHLCKCMHLARNHEMGKKECNICMCDKYDKSEMNGKITLEIETAKTNARARMFTNKSSPKWKIEKQEIKES